MTTISATIENCGEPKIFAKEVKIYVQLPETDKRKKQSSGLQWTGSKANLIELLYGLQITGVLNQSTATIKDIAGTFEKFFGVELGNVYNTFQEMRLRKKSRLPFLDLMKERLLQKMDEMDE
ncbi:MAG: RteC domain-containing protein [Chitinophagaceae bacterium]